MTEGKTTEKLYDKDAYLCDFTAKVISCEKKCDNAGNVSFSTVLDRTAFFPEEGGQTSDAGTIDGAGVLKVSIVNDVIIHDMDTALTVGSTVKGTIDWNHRFSNMQQHSGEHIFSGLVHSIYGFDNVGFHLSDDIVTMDYNGVLNAKDIAKIEHLANDAIYENFETVISWPDKDELEQIDYRSKKELSGAVRIVTFPGYDCCACCAPHIRRTGEIGILKVMSLQNYKGGVRVSILCGKRAVTAFDAEHELLGNIAAGLTTSTDQIQNSIDRNRSENQQLKNRIAETEEKIMEYRLQEIPDDQSNVMLFMNQDSSPALMRKTVNRLSIIRKGYSSVFCMNGKQSYRFIACSGDRDSRDFIKLIGEISTVKGGGSAAMVQGTVTGVSEEELKKFAANLK